MPVSALWISQRKHFLRSSGQTRLHFVARVVLHMWYSWKRSGVRSFFTSPLYSPHVWWKRSRWKRSISLRLRRLCVISSRWACLIFVKASSFWRFRMGPRGGMAPGGMSVWIREDGRRASERLESDEVLCSTARNKWASTLADALVYYPWSLQRSQGFFSTGVIWNFLLLFIYNVMSKTDKLEPSY